MKRPEPLVPARLTSRLAGTFALLALSVGVVAAAMATSAPTSLVLSLSAFLVAAFAGMYWARFEFLHPLVVVNGSFTGYSVSAPVLELMGLRPESGNATEVVLIQYAALLAFIAPQLLTATPQPVVRPIGRTSLQAGWLVAIACFLLSTVHLGAVISSGITSKVEKVLLASNLLFMDFPFIVMTGALGLIVLARSSMGLRFPWAMAAATLLATSSALLMSGGRSAFFRACLVLLCTFHLTTRRLRLPEVAVIAVVLMTAATMSGSLKMAYQAVDIDEVELPSTASDVVSTFFGSELLTASANLSVALWEVPSAMPYLKGTSLINDVRRAFEPGFLMAGETTETTSMWFTRTYYPQVFERGGGVGFSLVGTGYVNFGLVGVAGLFLLYGAFGQWLYRKATMSGLAMAAYVAVLPVLVTAPRGDISGLVGQPIKHVVLPFAMAYALVYVVRRGVRKDGTEPGARSQVTANTPATANHGWGIRRPAAS